MLWLVSLARSTEIAGMRRPLVCRKQVKGHVGHREWLRELELEVAAGGSRLSTIFNRFERGREHNVS